MINIENEGLFGDLSAWCYATEEQGRKTLHAHFLLWVKNWSVMLEKLRNPSENPNIELILRKYASTIMRTQYYTFWIVLLVNVEFPYKMLQNVPINI